LTQEDINIIEQCFLLMQASGEIDADAFPLIFELIEEIRKQDREIDKLTALNRHYFFHFYNGDFDKFEKDFSYLL
jgi:hypothetical protein